MQLSIIYIVYYNYNNKCFKAVLHKKLTTVRLKFCKNSYLPGKAVINPAAGIGNIESIPEPEPRGAYGDNDDNDSSGVLRYVSIRYGGTDIGEANEINGQ